MKRRFNLILTLVLVLSGFAGMANTPTDGEKPDTFKEESKHLVTVLDSMTNNLYVKSWKITGSDEPSKYGYAPGFIPVFHDSVYMERLALIPSVIPLPFTKEVKNYIDVYTIRKREQVQRMLGLGEIYFPVFQEVLDRKDLPHSLKNLAIVESALNPNAVSRMGATGLWQIMYSTGRFLDLNINSFIDERRDPLLSTIAAANYLESLYAIYDDWLMALGAYNCGPGNMNKAIARSGGKKTYWEVRPFLPAETRGYVPAFIAATYVMHYYEEHNILPLRPDLSYNAIDTVLITELMALEHVATFTGMSLDELKFLNPAVKKDVIPASAKGYALKLPITVLTAFEENRDSILLASRNGKGSAPAYLAALDNEKGATGGSGSKKIYYTVQSGDNLSMIAMWHDCTVTELRKWNKLHSNSLKIGQKLAVTVPSNRSEYYAKLNNMNSRQKSSYKNSVNPGEPSVVATSAPASVISAKDDNCNCVYHKVQNGDTLWNISKRYPGVSVDDIRRTNNISNVKSLKPGMVLKIEI